MRAKIPHFTLLELVKQFLRRMDAQELKEYEKVSAVWVKNLYNIINKMNNTNSSMIGINPKDITKVDIVELDKSESYTEKKVISAIYISHVNNMEIKK